MRDLKFLPVILLGIAALGKITSIKQLEGVIVASGLVPSVWAPLTSYGVIASEIACVVSWAVGFRRASLVGSFVLYSLFSSFHCWDLIHGIKVPCNCFGVLYKMPTPLGLGVSLAMMLISAASLSQLEVKVLAH